MGDASTRALYVGSMLGAFALIAIVSVIADRAWLLLGLLGLVTALGGIRAVGKGAQGRELIPVLEATGKTQLIAGLAMTIGLVLSG